jgi:hypothetical protein
MRNLEGILPNYAAPIVLISVVRMEESRSQATQNALDSVRNRHGDRCVCRFGRISRSFERCACTRIFEDFLETQYFSRGQTVLKRTKYGIRDCDLLRSTPGATDHTHYADVQTWLDHSIGFPVYVKKSIKATDAVKEFTYFGLRRDGSVWSASQIEGKIRGQADSTLLIIRSRQHQGKSPTQGFQS